MLDGSHHQVTHVLASDAACSGQARTLLLLTRTEGVRR